MARRTDVLRISAGTFRGTGFLIDRTHALTALHVIGRDVGGTLELRGPVEIVGAVAQGSGFRTPTFIASVDDLVAYDPRFDWACIRVEGLDEMTPPPVRELAEMDQSAAWNTYGFPDSAPSDGKASGGIIRSTAAMLRFGGIALRVVQVFSDEIAARGAAAGYSGGPMFIEGRVVAMLCAAQQTEEGAPKEATLYGLPVLPLRRRLLAAPASAPPRVAELVLAELAELAMPGIVASVCLVTDKPAALADKVRSWRDRLADDPLRIESVRQRIRSSSLRDLFEDPSLRRELLDRVSITSFNLYVYYAPAADERIVSYPLLHRFRKQSPAIVRVHARRDLSRDIERAIAQVHAEDDHVISPPASVHSSPLLELTEILLQIVARRLTDPNSEEARIEHEYVRTRIKLIMNVVTGQTHRREHDPLP